MALETYNSKRNFERTPEPAGDSAKKSSKQHELQFVVQEHHARALHYDFRLEMDGVLKSWAVPKGPPATVRVRRLAVHVEDHPLSYIDFAGNIPQGNYGAGSVTVWDHGTYILLGERSGEECIRRGKIEVLLSGNRLRGKYDLIRTDDDKDDWIFIKSIKQIETPAAGKTAVMPSPDNTECMLAVTGDKPFDDPKWLFEIKWDGYRAMLFSDSAGSHLVSRNHQSLDKSFPELSNASAWLVRSPAVIDGELVALTPDGKPNFQSLQNRFGFHKRSGKKVTESLPDTTIFYMAFDILYLDGQDLTGLPLTERKKILKEVIKPDGPIRYNKHIAEHGINLFSHLKEIGMEGVMAKKADSIYVHSRSDNWIKIKAHRSIDVIVTGYTESKAIGRPFASLLVGAYSGKSLIPLGHVGTGFNASSLESLHAAMQKFETTKSPYLDKPDVNGTPHWLKPELVAEVTYSELTGDNQLRHPVFVQLRSDKPASECVLDDLPSAAKTATDPKDSSKEMIDTNSDSVTITIDKHRVPFTHLNKEFWKETGSTKRDLLQYYAAVASTMLKHVAGRPIVVQRYPDGVGGMMFFQHDAGGHLPSFIKTFSIDEHNGQVRYALLDSEAALLHFINLGVIPIHTWNGRLPHPETPNRIIFDLDPTEKFEQTIQVALDLRRVLKEIGLEAYPKTSGANGLHLCIPIVPDYVSDAVVEFARTVGKIMTARFPSTVTTQRLVKNRKKDQVYLDCLQNGAGKTVVAPYSVRAQPTPIVSTPLSWDEVTDKLDHLKFTIVTVPARLSKMGDLYQGATDKPQNLVPAIELAKALAKGI